MSRVPKVSMIHLPEVSFRPQGGGYSGEAEVARDRFDHLASVGQIKNKIRRRALLYHSVQLRTH